MYIYSSISPLWLGIYLFWLRHKLHAFAGGRENSSLNLVLHTLFFLPSLSVAHKSLGLQFAMHNILIAATVAVLLSVSVSSALLWLKSIS